MRDLQELPKAHLHVHLDAAARPRTIRDLAIDQGVPVPNLDGFHNFAEFIASYFALLDITQQPAAYRRVIDEVVEDAANDAVRFLELGINPEFHARGFGSTEAALEAILDQLRASSTRHSVEVGVNLTVDRMAGYEASIATARLAVKYAGQGVTTLGLANEERGYPAVDFVDAFRIAEAAGLQLAPHAGELVGPESVWSAIRNLRSTRIQHGVRAVEDEALLAHLAESETCLDVCPTSNVVLGVYSTLEDHPLRRLLQAGVRCSINADDPTLFATSATSEFDLSRKRLGLTDDELASCARTSIEASAGSRAMKDTAARDIEAWLAG